MMTIEGIKGAGMTYQGSSSQAEVRQTAEIRTGAEAASNQIAAETTTITTKKSAGQNAPNYGGQENQQNQNEQIKRAVENINKNNQHTEAVFGIHEGTNRVTIKIVDKESKKVIKEYPPEQTLNMIEKVWEMAGLMVDEKR